MGTLLLEDVGEVMASQIEKHMNRKMETGGLWAQLLTT